VPKPKGLGLYMGVKQSSLMPMPEQQTNRALVVVLGHLGNTYLPIWIAEAKDRQRGYIVHLFLRMGAQKTHMTVKTFEIKYFVYKTVSVALALVCSTSSTRMCKPRIPVPSLAARRHSCS
jgi:hypothetical protein